MAGQTVRVEGLKDLTRQLRKISTDLVVEVKSVNLAAAKLVADDAADRAPRRTGTLADTIRAAGQVNSAIVRAGTAKVPYAGPIHFGWNRHADASRHIKGGPIAPNPFMYDALDARRAEVESMYAARIERLKNQVF